MTGGIRVVLAPARAGSTSVASATATSWRWIKVVATNRGKGDTASSAGLKVVKHDDDR